MYSVFTRLMFVLPFTIFIFITNTQAQTAIPAAMKQRMLKDMLKEKMHQDDLVQEKEEHDISGLLRTTASGSDKKITPNIAASISEGETSIAVDPNDSNNVVLSFMLEQGGLAFPIYYSSNGGSSWARSTFNAQTIAAADFPGKSIIGGGDPAFAWDKASGKLYFAWIYLTSNSSFDTAMFTLNWAYSTDKGKSWKVQPGESHFIGQGAVNPSTNVDYGYKDGVCDREWLTVDNSGGLRQGTLYCSFINFAIGGESVKVKAPTDTAFGSIHIAYSGSSQFGNVDVDKTGVLHMSVADISNNSIYHVSSSDGGASFSAPHFVASGVNLWGQAGIVHGRENSAPSLAIDATGVLHLTWCDFNGIATAYYSRSTNGGTTWSSPIRIDSLSATTYGSQTFMPTVAAAGNSVSISVTAIDGKDSARYYQFTSTNNGKDFDKWPVLLSATPTYYPQYAGATTSFFGDYNRSVSSICKTYAIWEDGRKSQGPKVYTAVTNHCTTGVQELTSVTTSLQLQSLYPNPASENVNLLLTDSKDEAVTIYIYDINGKAVAQHELNIHTGEQHVSIPLHLNAGMYVLSIMNKQGLVATRNLQVVK